MGYNAKRGFTLIELLVVIAIIGIIAAILFPVFAQAREKARAITCVSNEKQIALAELQYAQDYDEQIVPWCTTVDYPIQPSYETTWPGMLQPYLKNGLNQSDWQPYHIDSVDAKGVFKCPSWTVANQIKGMEQPDCDGPGSAQDWFVPGPTATYADYIISYYAMGGSGTQADPLYAVAGAGPDWSTYPSRFDTLALSAVLEPARAFMIGDGWTGMLSESGYIGHLGGCEGRYIHQGGENIGFLDGHVKYLKGNIARYETRGADGLYFITYATYNR